MSKRIFTVPDFYSEFKCKAGDCTKTCCHGWHITVSMKEYYSLLGLTCSEELRRRLDSGVYPLEAPKPERYAEFAKNYFGDCKMHGENGLCMIQCECGEDSLPSVCRYYPRSPRTIYADECSVSASCEAVCELLMRKEEPIKLVKKELEFKYELPEHQKGFIPEVYSPVRERLMSCLQDRAKPFSARLKKLVCEVFHINEILVEHDSEKLLSYLENDSLSCATSDGGMNIYSHSKKDGLETVQRVFARLSERFSLDDYTENVSEMTPSEYEKKWEKLSLANPSIDRIFEQLFVNHIFYMGFPFVSEYGRGYDACAAVGSLTLLYAILKVALTANTDECSFMELSNIISDIFKMAETSNYYLCAAALAREIGLTKCDKLCAVCEI